MNTNEHERRDRARTPHPRFIGPQAVADLLRFVLIRVPSRLSFSCGLAVYPATSTAWAIRDGRQVVKLGNNTVTNH